MKIRIKVQESPNIVGKGVCRRCGGSGWLLRMKLSNSWNERFKRCTTCGGHGIRWKLKEAESE